MEIVGGREARLRDVFDSHQRAVVAFVARRTDPPGDIHAAADIASEVFVIAWRKLDDIGSDPLPWLLVTARNVMSNDRRSRRRREDRELQHVFDRATSADQSPDIAHRITDVLVVRAALAALPKRDRELAMLLAWDDLSLVQAATVLGISPDAARTRWKRLRAKLADALAVTDESMRSYQHHDSLPRLEHFGLEAQP